MSRLAVYDENDPERPLCVLETPAEIALRLAPHGVCFARWALQSMPGPGSTDADILAAYAGPLAHLKQSGNYPCADVVRLERAPDDPGWPAKARAARGKFLAEHRHAEDEVRFFASGAGLFCLRLGGEVHLLLCEAGDLVSVPAGTRHWFDMGGEPAFCALRVFGSTQGWQAEFTGDDIASRFPGFDAVRAVRA